MEENCQSKVSIWLGGRDSNPDSQIQSLESYHWTTSQQEEFEFTYQGHACQMPQTTPRIAPSIRVHPRKSAAKTKCLNSRLSRCTMGRVVPS